MDSSLGSVELSAAAPRALPKPVRASPIRWWMPSLVDLFFLALLSWLFLSSGEHGWQSLLADADVGWHIRTGEYILDHRSVPHQDLYSFSKPSAPWFAWEWLSDVLFAVLHRWTGLKGVVLLAGVVIAAFPALLLRRMIWAGSHPFPGILVVLFGVGAASMHFLARPHVFTLLFLSLCMWMMEAERQKPRRWIWWLVPICWLWTNLHGGFLVLVAALGVAAAGAAAEAWLSPEKNWTPAIRWAKLTAACALVSLANPYGWQLHAHVFEFLRSDWIKNVVQEFQSPVFRGEAMMQFEALLFIGLIAAGSLLKRKRIVEGLWILLFAYLSLSSARHVPVFVAAVSPLVAMELTAWWQAMTAGAASKSTAGILNNMANDMRGGFARFSVIPVLGVLILALTGAPAKWPHDFPKKMFPTGIISTHSSSIFGARVFTTDQWADYLIYRNPAQKVFVDGRSDFYGAEIGDKFLHTVNGGKEWQDVLRQYQFDWVLLPNTTALVQLLKQDSRWRTVTDDGENVLLERYPRTVLEAFNKK